MTEKYLLDPKEATYANKAQLTTPPLREAGLDQKETSKKELMRTNLTQKEILPTMTDKVLYHMKFLMKPKQK